MTLAELAQWLEAARPIIAFSGGVFLLLLVMNWSLSHDDTVVTQCDYRRRQILGWIGLAKSPAPDDTAVETAYEAPPLY